jgi:hypothetical protein
LINAKVIKLFHNSKFTALLFARTWPGGVAGGWGLIAGRWAGKVRIFHFFFVNLLRKKHNIITT